MAQFLTFNERIVAEQYGEGSSVFVRFRGEKDFVEISGQDWNTKKKFVRYDSTKMTRTAAFAMHAAAQKKIHTRTREHTNASNRNAAGPDRPASS